MIWYVIFYLALGAVLAGALLGATDDEPSAHDGEDEYDVVLVFIVALLWPVALTIFAGWILVSLSRKGTQLLVKQFRRSA